MSDEVKPKSRRRRRRPRKKPPGRAVARASAVDTDRPADEALTAEEIADMRRHLAFLRRFRAPLRLKLNAKEDLLVNGSRAPEHRGTCKHLLAKVDRSSIAAALVRDPLQSDTKQRAEFLAGAAAISGDVGVLLSYLETLSSVASHDLAARAFSVTVRRIDFEAISPARMVRLLEIVEATFSGYGKVQAMFGLLQSERFRRAFDASIEAIGAEQARRFVPLRAVWETLEGSQRGGRRRGRKPAREALEEGLRELLAAPPAVLRGYPQRTRERLLDILLTSRSDWPYEHPGVRRLLESLPDDGALFRRHAFLCARGLIRQGLYSEAKALLKRVAKAHPDFREAAQLVEWLERPMLDRYALARASAERPPQTVERAYCLRRFRPVWLRWGHDSERRQLLEEARLHSDLAVPGVTPLLDSGVIQDATPFLACDATLERLTDRLTGKQRLPLEAALSLAQSGVAIYRMLASLGVSLPDAKPARFLVDLRAARPQLELVDLSGASRVEPEEARHGMAARAAELARGPLVHPPYRGREWRRDIPRALRALLEGWEREPPDLPGLSRALLDANRLIVD